jgi:hypothetical protein
MKDTWKKIASHPAHTVRKKIKLKDKNYEWNYLPTRKLSPVSGDDLSQINSNATNDISVSFFQIISFNKRKMAAHHL